KTVLITGGGSGIGFETARKLLETKEYHVVLMGKSREKLEDAAKSLGSGPELVSVSVCDLKDADQIRRAVEKIVGAYKAIYGLVNNAGIYPFGGLHSTTDEAWDETFAVNLKAPFVLI